MSRLHQVGRTVLGAVFGIIVLLAAVSAEAQTVWVVNRDGGDSVSVIDAATNEVVATIPVGEGPSHHRDLRRDEISRQ